MHVWNSISARVHVLPCQGARHFLSMQYTHSVSECECLNESVCNANKAYTPCLSERRAHDASITWTLLLLSCFGFIVWSMKHRLVGEELFCLSWKVKNISIKRLITSLHDIHISKMSTYDRAGSWVRVLWRAQDQRKPPDWTWSVSSLELQEGDIKRVFNNILTGCDIITILLTSLKQFHNSKHLLLQ